MGLLGSMNVRFGGDTSGLAGAAGQAKNILSGIGSGNPLGLVAMGFVAAGAAAVGFASQAVKMAGDFQESTTTLVTGAGESAKNIDMVRKGILQLAVDTGTSTKDIVSGMFMVESAGFHGAQGLNVMKVAAEGAKVGGANLGVVSNVLTTILHDYGMSGDQAAQAMNGLTATVQNGKMHLQDLASSMGSVLPLASALHISFPQVAGAIAEMTNSGMGAQRAATNLANTIRSLAAPNSAAVKSMKEVGLSAQDLKDTLGTKGLSATIQEVSDAVGKKFPAGSVDAVTAFKKIMGGATGYNVSLMLGGKNMADYQKNVTAITGAMHGGSGAVTGWSDVQKDWNYQMSVAHAKLETLMIKIGTAIIPILQSLMSNIAPVISAITGGISNLMDVFGNAFGHMQRDATESTLQTKIQTTNNTLQMAQGNVAHFTMQRDQIETLMQRTHSSTERHFLSMQLTAVDASLTQATGVVKNTTAMRNGIEDQLTQLDPAMHLHMLTIKDQSIRTSLDMKEGVVAQLQGQKDHIEKLIMETHDSTVRHMLEMKDNSITASLKQANGVVANMTKQKTGVEGQMSQLQSQMNADNNNIVYQAIQGFNQVKQAVGPVLSNIGNWIVQNNILGKALGFVGGVIRFVGGVIQFLITVVSSIINFYIQWHGIINVVAMVITAFFVPALIKTGVEAAIAGGKLAAGFISNMIKTGVEAVVNGAKTTASFVSSLIKAGIEGWASAGKIGSFIASMIQTGTAAVVNAAKVTGAFIASMVQTAAKAVWSGAQVVASFVASMAVAGAKALWAAAQVTGSFIVSMAQAGIQAAITAGQFLATLIPSIISFVAEALIAATTAIPAILAGFAAWIIGAIGVAAANIAAFWPVYLVVAIIIVIIGLVILAVKNWGAIAHWLQGVWGAISGFFKNLWNGIVKDFQIVVGFFHTAVDSIGKAFSGFGSLMHNIWNGIVGVVKGAINIIIGGIDQFISFIDGIQIHIPSIGVGPVHTPAFDWNGLGIPKIPMLAMGGMISASGWAVVGEKGPELVKLPSGANVFPNSASQQMVGSNTSGGGGQQDIYFQMDSKVLVHMVADKQARRVRLRMGRRAA